MQCQLMEIGIVWGLGKTVIIKLLGLCKGGNLYIHIWAWFGYLICSRREIRLYLFGKELISCLSSANVRAFHKNADRIYTELTFVNP